MTYLQNNFSNYMKDIYKRTWMTPDGKTVNQIDHLLKEIQNKKRLKRKIL